MKFKGFFHHIFEAVVINLMRLPRYGLETYGLSVPSSLGLIAFEISILPLALFYDLTTHVWRKKGLPVMQEDFIAMKHAPPFTKMSSLKDTEIPIGKMKCLKVGKWRSDINALLKKGEWEAAYKELEIIREELEQEKKLYPLCVHFLESVHRAVALTVIWSARLENQIEKERFLKERVWFVFWQMVGYEGALLLDWMSWPVRKKGCAILEYDVPVIPVPKI